MFLGQYYHNIDDKGRLTIPARYRELIQSDGAYLLQGFESNLIILPSPYFDILSHRVNRTSFTDPTARALRRLFFATASQVELDKLGRILIPQFLRQHAGLDSEAVVAGLGHYFEIWSPTFWSSQIEQLRDPQQNAGRFSVLDLLFE